MGPILIHTLNVLPPLVIENVLCCPMNFKVTQKSSEEGTLKKGEKVTLHSASFGAPVQLCIQIPGFYNWSSEVDINSNVKSLSIDDEEHRELKLKIDKKYVYQACMF